MSIEKNRQVFELWSRTHYVLSELSLDFEHGEYVEPEMQYAFEAWEASRAALVVELPEAWRSAGSTHELMHKRDTIAAIEAAGIKVKK